MLLSLWTQESVKVIPSVDVRLDITVLELEKVWREMLFGIIVLVFNVLVKAGSDSAQILEPTLSKAILTKNYLNYYQWVY